MDAMPCRIPSWEMFLEVIVSRRRDVPRMALGFWWAGICCKLRTCSLMALVLLYRLALNLVASQYVLFPALIFYRILLTSCCTLGLRIYYLSLSISFSFSILITLGLPVISLPSLSIPCVVGMTLW